MNLISFKILPVLQYLTKNKFKELEINKQNYLIFKKIQHKRMSDPLKPTAMLSDKKNEKVESTIF